MDREHFWLTEAQFECLSPRLPPDTRGKPRVDDRRVNSGIIHVLKSAHRCASGGNRGEKSQAIERSRGGRTTKINALTDERCRPVAFLLTGAKLATAPPPRRLWR